MKKITISLILLSISFSIIAPSQVFGDGLTQENLPPASVGDRDASLFIKINPPILTKDTIQDTYLELKLFDAKTGDVIKHTSFFVTVDKEGKLLMRNLFHTHSGDLTIKIQPTDLDVNNVVVYGDQEPFQGGWTSTNDQISVKAPILMDSGLYHFEIEIFGIDNDRNIFIPSDAPKFDSWLSVGDIFDTTVTSQDKPYDVEIISYYDQINEFNFDDATKTITFDMPFNWDLSRLEKQNVFVHEEIHFPTSFKAFSNAPTYTATVNGYPVVGRMLIADPYSLENTLILHYLINKEDIFNIAKTISSDSKTMEFKLTPNSAQSNLKDSLELNFDSGAKAQINYDSNLVSGKATPFEITFFDDEGKLLKWARYGYRIENSSGNSLYESENSDPYAPGISITEGIDKPEFSFQAPGKYKMTLAIFSSGLDGSNEFSGITNGNFELVAGTGSQEVTQIPSWIKNNAGWWASDQIDDNSFVQGIQWLITNGIMKIPSTDQGAGSGENQIPSWIKNNAGWWADGSIDDNSFVQGIQWLITNGIMKV